MPELPEVEIARRQLSRWSRGRRVVRVLLPDPAAVRGRLSSRPSDADPEAARSLVGLAGCVGEEPIRHGKRLGWVVGPVGLLAQFGMTAHLALRAPGEAPPDHARLGWELEHGAVIWFADARRFGCVSVVDPGQVAARLREGHGPDALLEPLDAEALAAALTGRRPIKVALLDQGRLAGLGNIHAAEACFRAGILPQRPCSELSPEAWARLAGAIPAQLAEAVAADDTDGEVRYVSQGGPNPFQVYGQASCGACGSPTRSEPQGGRTTWWCPACQR